MPKQCLQVLHSCRAVIVSLPQGRAGRKGVDFEICTMHCGANEPVGAGCTPCDKFKCAPCLLIRRRRPTTGNANPRGGKDPYVSPDGHNICDVRFYEQLKLFGEDAPVSSVCPAWLTECGQVLQQPPATTVTIDDRGLSRPWHGAASGRRGANKPEEE